MIITGFAFKNNICGKTNEKVNAQKLCEKYSSAYPKSVKGRDTVEISVEAYELQDEEKMSATSGKDTLGITKGENENTFIIHFQDSAMVSRAVARGYITVNGRDILLSDETKKKLMKVNEQAQADREKAYGEYVMQYSSIVAKQQARVLQNEAEKMAQAVAIAAKIAGGGKVTAEDEKFLMKYNPEMYAMAKSASIMAENKERQEEKQISEERNAGNDSDSDAQEGDAWSQCEWKSYETNMTVCMGEEAEILDIAENEIVVK